MEVQEIKQRFGIIGSSPLLNRAINIANQVAPTDISVLITGESGSGKEVFSQIIHQMSPRKHGPFIAVLFLKVLSILNYSATKKALIPVPLANVKDTLKLLTAALYF